MRKGRRAGAAMLKALPQWRLLAAGVIYLGAALQLRRLFF